MITRRFKRPAAVVLALLMLQSGVAFWDDMPNELKAVSEDYQVTFGVAYSNYGAEKRLLLADVYRPNGAGPFPTILMVHGGAWFSGNKAHVALHARDAAERGFAVVAINYRLAPAHKFPAQLHDCRIALRWIEDNAETYSFDTDRIVAYGYSAGAHLACLLGVTQNEPYVDGASNRPFGTQETPRARRHSLPKLKAVVAGGTPCEFSWIPPDSGRLSYWLGASPRKDPEAYASASPTSFVDSQDPPVFLFHGKTDRIVPISSAEKMKRQLDSKGVRSTLHVVAGANHLGAFLNADTRRRAFKFLAECLELSGEEE